MSIRRTEQEWLAWCRKISAGYIPTGGKGQTYNLGITVASYLIENEHIKQGDCVLDVGSGNGRLPMGLYALDMACTYYGMEIILPCVQFCKSAFEGMGDFTFDHINLVSRHYWDKGKIPPEKVDFPYPDSFFDVVIAMSLFSHTGTLKVALRNLQEMKRVMKKSGRIFSTWYFGDEVKLEKKTVYQKSKILDVVNNLDMSYEEIKWGATDQAVLILRCKDEDDKE